MKIKNIIKFAAPLSIAALLSACGGGGSSGSVGVVPIVNPSAPNAPTVSLNYGIRQLQFSWEAVPNATYYRLSENPDGTSGYSVVADNLTDTSVNHDITLYQRINARYMVDACNDVGCTASSEILMTNHLVDAIGYFKGSNTETYDEFGVAVSLSADGTTLAVGANGEASAATGVDGDQTDNNASNSGAVYIFKHGVTGWAQQAYLKASNTQRMDGFGSTLSLSSDGNTLAVGAPMESSSATGVDGDQTDNGATYSGAAYIFTFDGTTWAQQAYLKASNTETYDYFGSALSISADGNTLAVGAYAEDSSAMGVDGDQLDNSASGSGAAYVFARSGTVWSQQAYLKASTPASNDYFGGYLSLSGDGTKLGVGYKSGVELFAFGGSSWAQQQSLSVYCTSLSLSGNGTTLAVGASETEVTGLFNGAVYLYAFDGTSWSQQAFLTASNTEEGDRLGSSVSLSGDGNTLAVGAYHEASAATGINGDQTDNSILYGGAVYLFAFDGTTWTQQSYIKSSDPNEDDEFGGSVSLSGDGNTLAVGAIWEDSAATGIGGDSADNSAIESGAIYIY